MTSISTTRKRSRVEDGEGWSGPGSQSDDSIVYRSRKRQHRLETPELSCTLSAEVPGAPTKSRESCKDVGSREAGRQGLSFGYARGDSWEHRQAVFLESVQSRQSESGSESEADVEFEVEGGGDVDADVCGELGESDVDSTEDECPSFVVESDVETVGEAMRRCGGQDRRWSGAEVRLRLEEKVDRLTRRLRRAEAELVAFDAQQEAEDSRNGICTQRQYGGGKACLG